MKTDYFQLAEKIYSKLYEDIVWEKPWQPVSTNFMNPSSGSEYHGKNCLLLELHNYIDQKFDHRFMTFNQIKKENLKLKKGSKGIRLSHFCYDWTKETKEKMQKAKFKKDYKMLKRLEKEPKIAPKCTYFTVFHGDDIEGLEPLEIPDFHTKIDENFVQNICDAIEVEYRTGAGNESYYNISKNFIQLPLVQQFKDEKSFYEVFFHELTHATGKKFERDFKNKIREEITAEFGTFFLMTHFLGQVSSSQMQNIAAYIKSWSSDILDNPKADKVQIISDAIADSIMATEHIIQQYNDNMAKMEC